LEEEEESQDDFILAVEFVETREDKLHGRNKFIPKIVGGENPIMSPEEVEKLEQL